MAAPPKITIKIHGVITWLKIEWQKSLERYYLKIVGLICSQFHEKPTLNPVMKLCIDTCLSCGVMIYPWPRKGSQRYKIRTSNMLNFFPLTWPLNSNWNFPSRFRCASPRPFERSPARLIAVIDSGVSQEGVKRPTPANGALLRTLSSAGLRDCPPPPT